MNTMNLLFVGLGPLGRMIITDYLKRGLGAVAGVVDIDPSLNDRSLAEALGDVGSHAAVTGVAVRRSVEEALRHAATPPTAAVVATSSDLPRCMPTLRDLLSRGISVVSTCEELLNPWFSNLDCAREIEKLCAENKARCVGTGVNPGFLMDALPVWMTAVCRQVAKVRIERYQDASTRRIPFQKKIGATLTDAEFARRVADKSLRHVGLGESLHYLNHYLSLGVVRWEETIGPVRAARELTCALGEIAPGGISGVRQTAHGWNARKEEVITLEFQAAIGQENPRDRIVIQGDPPIESVIPGAVHGDAATSAITINTIPSLLAAPPGLHTMTTLPGTHFVRGA